MPSADRTRIVLKIEQYARDPESLANNIKKMAGATLIRLRVGHWRVIMSEDHVVLNVIKIGPRDTIYHQVIG